ncbi:MAG: hypothetical protein IPJ41_16585 [Phycisphaerales bacterium]|nr:hypothetical protein [Phycisphaerales bacterium]
MDRKHRMGILAAGAAAILAGHAWGQCFSDRVTASDKQSTDLFGAGVAMTWNGASNNLIVGAPREDAKGTDAGAVYCFTDSPGQWWEFAKLTAADTVAGDYFGSQVAIDGNRLIVAAPGTGSTGKAYLFDRFGSQWSQTGVFTGAASTDGFGAAVAIDGNVAVIGAPYNDAFASDSGAAYVYERSGNGWVYTVTLTAYHLWRNPGDWCGFSADVDGSKIVVGIPNGDAFDANDCGFAQTFVKANGVWGLSGALYAPDHQTGDDMGYSVAIDGNTAVVGAPGATVGNNAEAGAVYVFHYNGQGWDFDRKVTAYPSYANARFGSQVSLSQGVIAVNTGGKRWVYTFEQNASGDWAQMSRITDPDGGTGKFGATVAINNGLLAIGDYQADDGNLSDNGAAYVTELDRDGGDVCQAATPIGQGAYSGCTTNATVEGSSSCLGGTQISPDIFFSYYAAATGKVNFDTFGSDFNTVLSVHEGCPANSQNAIACNDDWSIFEQTSSVQAYVTKGHEYIVRVSGVNGAKGGFLLHVSALVPDPCPADFNHDGTVNTIDFISFLNAWNAKQAAADFNGDGVINTIDVLTYLNAFTAGC